MSQRFHNSFLVENLQEKCDHVLKSCQHSSFLISFSLHIFLLYNPRGELCSSENSQLHFLYSPAICLVQIVQHFGIQFQIPRETFRMSDANPQCGPDEKSRNRTRSGKCGCHKPNIFGEMITRKREMVIAEQKIC